MATAAGRTGAAESGDVKAVEQKATTAFALGRFAEAGATFEKAYELKPDAALLYNAAQSYRLAGNKERALSLYENYQRVYGKREKREEVEKRIAELKQAIEHDKAVSTSPPTGTEPVGATKAVSAPPPPPADKSTPEVPVVLPAARDPEASSSHPVLVSQPEQADADGSVMKKPWFWAIVGGGVAAAVVVGVVLASGGSKDPSPSMGKVNGN